MIVHYLCKECGFINEVEVDIEFSLLNTADSDVALSVECGECLSTQALVVHLMLDSTKE